MTFCCIRNRIWTLSLVKKGLATRFFQEVSIHKYSQTPLWYLTSQSTLKLYKTHIFW